MLFAPGYIFQLWMDTQDQQQRPRGWINELENFSDGETEVPTTAWSHNAENSQSIADRRENLDTEADDYSVAEYTGPCEMGEVE